MITKDEVRELVNLYKDIFPHIRDDYLSKVIDNGNILYTKDGSGLLGIIIFKRYVKNTKYVNAGDFELSQIIVKNKGKGIGSSLYYGFERLVIKQGAKSIVLTVRESNTIARNFYDKIGMNVVGKISWKNGSIPGLVYKKVLVKTLM